LSPAADREAIDAYWSEFLGVPPSALRESGITFTAHAALAGYRGLWLFVRGQAAVVSAPADWLDRAERALVSARTDDLLSREYVANALGRAAGVIVGPSFQGWLRPVNFRPLAHEDVRMLAASDRSAVVALRASVSPEEWEHGDIDPDRPEIFGVFRGNRAVALGQLRAHAGGAVDPCVLTHPAERGLGHAARVVSTLVERALAAGRLVLYQTLLSNGPALAVARRVGFEPYATLLAVRLTPDAE
jgi:GNAT superfamily N-acetyltransferase